MKRYRQIITEVVALVEELGQPLTLRELSAALAVPAAEIRRQVRAYDVDIPADALALHDTRPEVFIIPSTEDDDHVDCDEDAVGVSGTPSRDLLGVERFDAAVLGPLFRAAVQLAAHEPENRELAEAIEKLRAMFLPGMRPVSQHRAEIIGQLGQAMGSNQRGRIRYSRAWEPGVLERDVEPYRLVWTRRGPELDAGPLAPDGSIRTYIVGRIESMTVLAETFVRPPDADERSAASRQTTTVTGVVPADRLWVVERSAEATRVLRREDDLVWFSADLREPVNWRAGRIAVVAGAGTRIDSPGARKAAAEIAQRVWDHHDLGESAAA